MSKYVIGAIVMLIMLPGLAYGTALRNAANVYLGEAENVRLIYLRDRGNPSVLRDTCAMLVYVLQAQIIKAQDQTPRVCSLDRTACNTYNRATGILIQTHSLMKSDCGQ